MQKIEIYCQQEFLDSFIQKMNNFNLIDESSSFGYIYNMYLLIFKNNHTKIYSDLTNQEICLHSNPYIKSLRKNNKIESKTKDFIEVIQEKTQKDFFENIENCTKFFFLNISPNLAERIEEKFGYIVISKDKIETIEQYFTFHRISLSNKLTNNWDFVRNYKHPCNSIVITDDHLGKTGQDIRDNIIPLLRRIMPSKLDTTFHLTIIGFSKLTKEQFEEVKNELESSFKSNRYPVCLYIIQHSYHDRFLFTNYYHFSCGQGFNMVKAEKGKKVVGKYYSSILDAVSIALTNSSDVGNSFKVYSEKLEELSEIFKDYRSSDFPVKKNRLLEKTTI